MCENCFQILNRADRRQEPSRSSFRGAGESVFESPSQPLNLFQTDTLFDGSPINLEPKKLEVSYTGLQRRLPGLFRAPKTLQGEVLCKWF